MKFEDLLFDFHGPSKPETMKSRTDYRTFMIELMSESPPQCSDRIELLRSHRTYQMNSDQADIPGVTDDPVIRLLLSGQAATLDEAEEMYLDASLPEIYELLRRPATDAELMQHPLFRLLVVRGSRGWEDSLL